jgi:hypothetical protein
VLGGCEGRPAAQAVTKERRLVLLQPLQDVWEGVCEGTGQAVGEPDLVADQAPTVCDAWRQGAPGGAVGAEGGQRVTVCEEQCDLACGVGRGICGPARGQRCAVLGPGEGMDGHEPEARIVAQRRHDGPWMAFQAHGKRLPVAPRTQAVAPRVEHLRAVVEAQQRPVRSAAGLSTDIVCGLRPVEADTRRTCLCRYTLHVSPRRVWESGQKGQACWRSTQA